MVYYRFAINNINETEVLGGIPLADDDTAVLFGRRVIQDLTRYADQRGNCTMLITRGERTISIPFNDDM
jgi:hypothetical protein